MRRDGCSGFHWLNAVGSPVLLGNSGSEPRGLCPPRPRAPLLPNPCPPQRPNRHGPRCPPEPPLPVRPGADARGSCMEGGRRGPPPVCCPRPTSGSHRDRPPLKAHTQHSAVPAADGRGRVQHPHNERTARPFDGRASASPRPYPHPKPASCGAVQGPACVPPGRLADARLCFQHTRVLSRTVRIGRGSDIGGHDVRMPHLRMETCHADRADRPALTRTRRIGAQLSPRPPQGGLLLAPDAQ